MSASDHEQAIPTDAGPIERLFRDAPADVGLAFMIVEHPLDDFNRVLDELVTRRAARAVQRVEHGMPVRGDAVYLVPGDSPLRLRRGIVELDAVAGAGGEGGLFLDPRSAGARPVELRQLPGRDAGRGARSLVLFRHPGIYPSAAARRAGRGVAAGADLLAGVHEDDRATVAIWLRDVLDGRPAASGCECRLRTAGRTVRLHAADASRAASAVALTPNAADGAPARDEVSTVLGHEMSQARRNGGPLVVLVVRCDTVAELRVAKGVEASEETLRAVTRRLVATLRPSDWVMHAGADELAVILPETRIAEGLHVVGKLRRALSERPLRVGTRLRNVTARFGAAVASSHPETVDGFLARARDALDRRARCGENGGGERDRAGSGASAPGLANGGGFRTVAQPIWDLRSNTVIAFEMLSRGPAGPLERPDDLFRVCMDTNSLTEIDLLCLRRALERAVRLEPDRRVHVNLFPSTIIETDLRSLVDLFASTGSPERFCLEISEQQLVGNPAALHERTSTLKSHGVEIAVDDVGFGRSSLETLIVLEPDVIKIDRSMVTGVATEPALRRSLDRLIQVSHGLDARLIAEGIETREDRVMLLDMGVSAGQGFLWGKPYNIS